jgi:flavin reductase (DIM6/NTAB) family NADH-FMN oxidoreductase RutF
MIRFLKSIKNKAYRVWFSLTKGEYMRVAYLQPRSIALVTSRLNGRDNILPVDWHMPLSFTPKLYAICLESGNFSSEMISASGVFVVNFMGAEHERQILDCGRISGKDCDKFETAGFEKTEASKISAPVIKNSLGYLECKVISIEATGDHTLFTGKVVFEKERLNKKQLYHKTNNP